MENFEQAKKAASHELTEHAGIPGPELELPLHTPTPEIKREEKISPEALDDLIQNPAKQWDRDDERDNPEKKDTPTLH
jgi:hypothetical protein